MGFDKVEDRTNGHCCNGHRGPSDSKVLQSLAIFGLYRSGTTGFSQAVSVPPQLILSWPSDSYKRNL